jgi:chemotaxis protein MotB
MGADGRVDAEMMPVARNRIPPVAVSYQFTAPHANSIRARSASSSYDGDANWWMITLSDLTLLLLGFLVLWYATAKIELKPAPVESPKISAQIPPIATTPRVTPLSPEVWQVARNDLSRFIGLAGLAKDVEIEVGHNDVVFSLRDSVPFASGRADLRPRALPVLEKIVSLVLAQAKLSVAISGHTDSVRIANNEFPSNWELSTARASRVARYLIEKGIAPSRISVQGYAGYRPRLPNSTATNRRLNRRVEIRLFQELAPGGEK